VELRGLVMRAMGAVFLGMLLAAVLVAPAQAAPPPPVLFVHVNVVPMDRERVLRDQSVLVEDGVITGVGRHLDAPKDARVIDGHRTEYLSPGLADMHVHSTTKRDMQLFLANGVTTVLNMGGERNGFMDQVVPELNSGELPGPHFYSSFIVDGTPEYGQFVVATPAQARALVDLAKTNGYDFIKVYNNLAPDTFQAFIEAGREAGVPVIGHGVTRVGLERQFAAGQVMVAHTEEYFYTVFFPAGVDVGTRAPKPEQIPDAIAFTKRYGAYVTADLNTYATIARQWGKPEVVTSFLQAPEVRYLDPDDRLGWQVAGYTERKGSIDDRVAFLKVFTKALSDAGVPLITGTDTPVIPGLVPGFSLHQDMRLLEAAGLSRYQVLAAATRTPGEFIAKTKPGGRPFGTVSVGARADLVLSAANPLDDLATLETPLGVMGQGRWYSADDLKAMLDGLAAKYEAATRP
jgi:hypothetical protein